MSPRISSPAHPSGGDRGRGRGGGRGGGVMKRDREIIGQTVRIVQGPFKGNCHINVKPYSCFIYWLYFSDS